MTLLSLCCSASVTVAGRTTRYYVCGECGRACDATETEGETG